MSDYKKFIESLFKEEREKFAPRIFIEGQEEVNKETPEEEETPEVTKEYLGKTEDTHYYLVFAEEPEDLQLVDQEGTVKYSAKDHNIELSDVATFVIQAIQDSDIEEIDRNILLKYIFPELLEEEEPEEAPKAPEEEEKPEEAPKAPEEEEKPEEERPEAKSEGKVPNDKDSEQTKINKLTEQEGLITPEEEKTREELLANFEKELSDLITRTLKSMKDAAGEAGFGFRGPGFKEQLRQILNRSQRVVSTFEGKVPDDKDSEETKINELVEEKGREFKSEAEFKEAVKKFEDTINKKSKVVKVRVRKDDLKFDESEGYQSAHMTFDVLMEIPSVDKYLDSKKYEEGTAYIYPSNEFYELVDQVAEKCFAEKPEWNNVKSIGWIYVYGSKGAEVEEEKLAEESEEEAREIIKKLTGKALKESKVSESKNLLEMKVTDDEGNEFDVYLEDDSTIDTVISINGREFRFTPEFAGFWRDEEGVLSEEGLRELALEALVNLDDEEYQELLTKEEEESAPKESPSEPEEEEKPEEAPKAPEEEEKPEEERPEAKSEGKVPDDKDSEQTKINKLTERDIKDMSIEELTKILSYLEKAAHIGGFNVKDEIEKIKTEFNRRKESKRYDR